MSFGRREFVKGSVAAGVALTAPNLLLASKAGVRH